MTIEKGKAGLLFHHSLFFLAQINYWPCPSITAVKTSAWTRGPLAASVSLYLDAPMTPTSSTAPAARLMKPCQIQFALG